MCLRFSLPTILTNPSFPILNDLAIDALSSVSDKHQQIPVRRTAGDNDIDSSIGVNAGDAGRSEKRRVATDAKGRARKRVAIKLNYVVALIRRAEKT